MVSTLRVPSPSHLRPFSKPELAQTYPGGGHTLALGCHLPLRKGGKLPAGDPLASGATGSASTNGP